MNIRNLRWLSAACFLVVNPRSASAQFESFLEKVNDLSFFLSCWQVRGEAEKKGDCPKGKNGYGLEVSFDVGNLKLGKREDTTAANWKKEKREEITENRTMRTVVTSIYVKESVSPRSYLQTEVALGYSQFSGFESGNPDLDLRGTVRELPSVAVYGTYISKDFELPFDISP